MKTHADEPVVVRLSPIVHATEQLKSLVDKGVDSDVVLDVSDLGFATSMLINELLELRTSSSAAATNSSSAALTSECVESSL